MGKGKDEAMQMSRELFIYVLETHTLREKGAARMFMEAIIAVISIVCSR